MDWSPGALPGFQRVEDEEGRPFYLTIPVSGGSSLKLRNWSKVKDYLRREGLVGYTEKDFDFKKRKGETPATSNTAPKSSRASDLFGEEDTGVYISQLTVCTILRFQTSQFL